MQGKFAFSRWLILEKERRNYLHEYGNRWKYKLRRRKIQKHHVCVIAYSMQKYEYYKVMDM